jgi:7-cyano-7-deazaguanine synthase
MRRVIMEQHKTLAITGANGFLGTNLEKSALSEGWTVIGIVRSEAAASVVDSLGGTSCITLDYSEEDLKRTLQGVDVIVHTIAIGCAPDDIAMDVNLNITKRLLNACRASSVKKFIYISGLGVAEHGANQESGDSYYRTKYLAERGIEASGIPYVIFRPSFIFGALDYTIESIVRAIGNGRVTIPCPLDATLQPIAIDDAVASILRAAGTDIANKIYDLVGPETITIEDTILRVFNAIKNCNVLISPPVIESVDASSACTEAFEALKFPGQGSIDGIVQDLEIQPTSIDPAIDAAVRAIIKPDEVIPENRAVLLVSGGLDSITALYWAVNEGYDVIPVSMLYPNRPMREIWAVKEITKRLDIKLTEVPTPFIKEVFDLKLEGYPVPSLFGAGDYYVPYRNLVFNAIATFYADINGARFILSGHIAPDSLPDANEPFFDALEHLVAQIKVGEKAVAPKFLLPLKGMTKADGVRLAIKLGVPLEWTWSCAFDGDAPCGHCKPCRERAAGFEEAGVNDPVLEFRPPAKQ